MSEASPEDIKRFMSFVDKLYCGCWYWGGARSRGKGNKKWYATFGIKRDGKWRTVKAHDFACREIGGKGELPKGYERDHICRFSMCVRPDHIEYVTKKVNGQRRWQDRTHEPEMHFDA